VQVLDTGRISDNNPILLNHPSNTSDLQTHNSGMDSTRNNSLCFLTRDMTTFEIDQCEQACMKYINNDDFEIEIHNLNEINEYFRIFKDIVIKNQNIHNKDIEQL
jgi:hypothetical protein